MEFNGHPYPNGTKSYPPQADVLKYLHSYADRFEIKKHIKLSHLVIRVVPIENEKWEVIVKDLPNDKFHTLIYDVVFVANGHFASPRYPSIPGLDEFQGKLLHSHDYRSAEAFHGRLITLNKRICLSIGSIFIYFRFFCFHSNR